MTVTTTLINSQHTITTDPFDDNNDMTRILSYAIPLSCVVIVMVLLMAFGIHRRYRVFEKWSSLKQMSNTNPRYTERAGLRRDSEYDSDNDKFLNVTIINVDEQLRKEPEFRLATIT